MRFRPGAPRPDVRPQVAPDDRVPVLHPGDRQIPDDAVRVIDLRGFRKFTAENALVNDAYANLITDIRATGTIVGSKGTYSAEQVVGLVEGIWSGNLHLDKLKELTNGGSLLIRERLTILLQRRAQEAAQQGRGGRQRQRRAVPQPQARRPEAEVVANPDAWRADLDAQFTQLIQVWRNTIGERGFDEIWRMWFANYRSDPRSGGVRVPDGTPPQLYQAIQNLWRQLSNLNDQRLGR